MGPTGYPAAGGGASTPDYAAYHDTEWGFPVADDRRLFEKICLEGFQSGLSWLTILRKRDNFRAAFADFDIERIASFDETDIARLLDDAGIVRHRGKIEATINNAQRAVEMLEERPSLAGYFWSFEPSATERPASLTIESLMTLTQTPASVALAKDLKRRGVAVRGPHHGLCVHASHGSRQRPPRGMRCSLRRRVRSSRLRGAAMSDAILQQFDLGMQWPTPDPFLFCAHHRDAYPPSDGALAPNASLQGRTIGEDFANVDGWNMYHGSVVPGFPQHPHRGFETITYLRNGWCDHSDSLGATARFGNGDVQWMTAGRGINHAEMFPLLSENGGNPLELFQIWLNLPATDKMVEPYFTMIWDEAVPTVEVSEHSWVKLIAGSVGDTSGPSAPPNSWAARPEAGVTIWHVHLAPGDRWALPAEPTAGHRRTVYGFEGAGLTIDGVAQPPATGAAVDPARNLVLAAGPEPVEVMVLGGSPIGEPVAQYGPFVMNTEAEIRQAVTDYQSTQFGGWPWPTADPTHGVEPVPFARHADGREEHPSRRR